MNPDEEPPTQEPPAGPYVEPDPELAAIWESFVQPVITTVFHDGDGSVFIYDQYGQLIEKWPEGWPETIGDVPTFCRERGITYRS